jgi:hypothetical protein
MQIVQLFVDGQRVELFKDESITLTQTIQNVKDIGSIFTDFSKSFTMPASKINNRVFKHFYDDGIANGFNANDKLPAKILLNQQEFRKGFLALDGVKMTNNKPYAYKATFFGETVDLKKKLKEISLQNVFEAVTTYNHDYNRANVLQGLRANLISNNIIYPLISHTERLYFDSSNTSAGSRNLDYAGSGPTNNQGVRYTDLKPAIRVSKVIEEIENFAGLEFNKTDADSFFNTSQNDIYDKLYLWIARQKGDLAVSYSGGSQIRIPITGIGYIAGDINTWSVINPLQDATCYTNANAFGGITPFPCANSEISGGIWSCDSWYYNNGLGYPNYQAQSESYSYSLTITSSSSQPFNIICENVTGTTSIQNSIQNQTGTGVLQSFILGTNRQSFRWVIETSDPNFTYSADLRIKGSRILNSFFSNYTISFEQQFRDIQPTTGVSRIVMSDQMPNIKVLEFLTGMFKMFNLTAFIQRDGKVKVMTLDKFMETGIVRDITKYVAKNKSDIDYAIPYQEVALRWQEPKTFLAHNFNEINNNKFGFLENCTQQPEVASTDRGNKYVITLPFEKMIYERLSDGSVRTNIAVGWSVDKDQNATLTKPLLFLRRQTQTGYARRLSFYSGIDSNNAAPVTQYNRAANSLQQETINFGSEVDEWTGITKDRSLFNEYYLKYIKEVFSQKRRAVKITAFLPPDFLRNYSLADRLQIGNRFYIINSITTNLKNNESKLELFNYTSNIY